MAKPVLSVSLNGVKDLQRQLRRLGTEVERKSLQDAVMAGAEVIRAEASRLAPRRTGRLAANIEAVLVKKRKDQAIAHIGPNKEAWYGIFAELGTSHHPAQPFLRPAFDSKKDEAMDAAADKLRAAIAKAVR